MDLPDPPPSRLAPRLAACRDAPGAWLPSYAAMVARLVASGATDGAPAAGQIAPDFALPDATGRLHRLDDLVAAGPVVLSFNRGSWCPYCAQEILAWAECRAELLRRGGRLVILTPETGGRMAGLAALAGPEALVLCDTDLGAALRYGLAFPVGTEILDGFRAEGLDLSQVNGGGGGFLPVPATFLLGVGRRVRYAFVNPDFTRRAEPEEVLAALDAAAPGR